MRYLTPGFLAAAFIVIAVGLPITSYAAFREVPVDEMIQNSDIVFVGTVDSIYVEIFDNVPETKAHFDFHEKLFTSKNAAINESGVWLTYAGGRFPDGRVAVTSDMPYFEVGKKYLVFARLQDKLITPVVGGHAGQFLVLDNGTILGFDGKEVDIVEDDGREWFRSVRLFRDKKNRAAPMVSEGATVEKHTEEQFLPMTAMEVQEAVRNIGRLVSVDLPELPRAGSFIKVDGATEIEIPLPASKKLLLIDKGDRQILRYTPDKGILCFESHHNSPWGMEQVSPGALYDIIHDVIGDWNRYVNTCYEDPDDGSYGMNGQSEIVGFGTSIYGHTLAANELAVTWSLKIPFTDIISESDILFNSAITWTQSAIYAMNNYSVVNLVPVAMHEFGHALGYIIDCTEDYSYDYLSVMHGYYHSIYEDGRGLHAADASRYRTEYSGEANPVSIHDVGVEAYNINTSGYISGAYTNSIYFDSGDQISIYHVVVENIGTYSESDVRLRAYLSLDHLYDSGDYQLSGYTYWTTLQSGYFSDFNPTFTIPSDVPTGQYYVLLRATINGSSYSLDDLSNNNSSVVPDDMVNVTCPIPLGVSNCVATDNLCDRITMTWADNSSSETGFKIYRNGSLITTTAANVTSYNDTPSPGTYSYYIVATGACGDASASNTNSGTRLSVPSFASNCIATDNLCDRITVTWSDNSSNETGFKIYRNGSLITTTAANTTIYNDTPSAGTYSYYIVATNSCGNSSQSNSNSGTRLSVPSAASNCVATDNLCDRITVTWSDNSSNETGFKVYRNSSLIGTTSSNVTSYNDEPSAGTYSYYIVATNSCGNSSQSNSNSGTRLSVPSVASNCVATDNLCDRITVTWSDNSSNETGFKVYRNSNLIGTTISNITSYNDTPSPGTYSYYIVATGACGDASASNTNSGTRLSVPSFASNCIATDNLCDRITVTWSDNSSNETGFEVYRNSNLIGTTSSNVTSYNDTPPVGTYSYYIVATGACGNSSPSDTNSGTRIDETIVIQSPVGGETWLVDSDCEILWSSNSCIQYVNVELSRAGSEGPWESLFSSLANDGSETWTCIGNASTQCLIRVSDASDGTPVSSSASFFTIELVLPTTYYVSTSGNNTNPGTIQLPFATIQHGLDVSAPGDTVMVADGTYIGDGNRDLTFNGKSLVLTSQSNEPESCIIDCEGSSAEHHRGLIFSSGEDSLATVRGLTIKNGYADYGGGVLCLQNDGHYPDLPPGDGGSPRLKNCIFSNNTGSGIVSLGYGSFAALIQCQFIENIGDGAYADGFYTSFGYLKECDFIGNTGSGVVMGYWDPGNWVIDCNFTENGNHGYDCFDPYGAVYNFTRVTSSNNGGYGIHNSSSLFTELTMNDVSVVNNELGGIYHNGSSFSITNSVVSGNGGNGIESLSQMWPYMRVIDTIVTDNDQSGMVLSGQNLLVEGCIVSQNGSNGIIANVFDDEDHSVSIIFNDVTIASNTESGIILTGEGMPEMTRVLISDNLGPAVDCQGIETPQLSCSNLYGNTGGDWIGAIAGQYEENDNNDVIPLFCDADAGDYTLQSNSLLLNQSTFPCGFPGALGEGCEAPVLSCRELQSYDSQTGEYDHTMMNVDVTVSGNVFVPPGTYSPTGGGYLYDETGGMNFWASTIPEDIDFGTQIEITGPLWPDGSGELYVGNYSYEILGYITPEPIEFSIGELISDYSNTGSYVRVTGDVINMASDSFWLDDGTGQIEIRNIPYTGVDYSEVIEGDTWIVLSPAMRDQALFFLSPPDSTHIFMDPTGVEGEGNLPVSFALHPCYPNPFNPMTTIMYDLPEDAVVRLNVYDVSGRLIRDLVSSEMISAGRHEVIWNGREGKGRVVSAGVYFYKLEAAGYTETRRMTLVK
jgi:hypothetical protein